MKALKTGAVCLLVTALAAAGVLGQQPSIHTTVPLVTVRVSVTNRHGQPIDGLTSSDFILLDNQKPRSVHVDTIDSGLAPIALVSLIQTSDISLSSLAKIKKWGP